MAREWGLYVSRGSGRSSLGIEEPPMFIEPALFLVRPDRSFTTRRCSQCRSGGRLSKLSPGTPRRAERSPTKTAARRGASNVRCTFQAALLLLLGGVAGVPFGLALSQP